MKVLVFINVIKTYPKKKKVAVHFFIKIINTLTNAYWNLPVQKKKSVYFYSLIEFCLTESHKYMCSCTDDADASRYNGASGTKSKEILSI